MQNVTVEFPLGVLCLVTGVSGAGKSTLVNHTLYPGLARQLHKDSDQYDVPQPLGCDDVLGAGQLQDVVHIDQSPIGRSPRSNPMSRAHSRGVRRLGLPRLLLIRISDPSL